MFSVRFFLTHPFDHQPENSLAHMNYRRVFSIFSITLGGHCHTPVRSSKQPALTTYIVTIVHRHARCKPSIIFYITITHPWIRFL